MKFTLLSIVGAAALLSSCAQTMGALSDGSSPAMKSCNDFAIAEKLKPIEVGAASGSGSAQTVSMQLEDRVGRRFTATCSYSASGQASWTKALPSNVSQY